MSTRPQRNRAEATAETKRRIVDATLELMAARPFDQITMAEIGRHAGISYGSITHHFGSKQGLLMAIFGDSQDRLTDLLAGLGPAPASNASTLAVLTDWYASMSPSAPMILVESVRDPVMGEALAAQRAALMDRVAAFLGGPHAEYEAQGLTGLADGLALLWRLMPEKVDHVRAWNAVLRLVILGLNAEGRLSEN